MILELQYPHTLLGLTFTKKRKIGFLFTNLEMFQFRQNTGVTDSKELDEWIQKNGQHKYTEEILFGAAQAYCMTVKKQENFTKEKLLQAIKLSSEEIQKKLMKEWDDSIDKTVLKNGKKKAMK